MTFIMFSQTIITSETEFKMITIDDLPWAESRGQSEVDTDSFCVDVESIYDPTDGEILDEANMMGN